MRLEREVRHCSGWRDRALGLAHGGNGARASVGATHARPYTPSVGASACVAPNPLIRRHAAHGCMSLLLRPCCALRRDGQGTTPSQGGNCYAEIPDAREMPASTRSCSPLCLLDCCCRCRRARPIRCGKNAIDRTLSGSPQHSVDRHHRNRRADPVSVRRARSDNRRRDHAAARPTNGMAHPPRSAARLHSRRRADRRLWSARGARLSPG